MITHFSGSFYLLRQDDFAVRYDTFLFECPQDIPVKYDFLQELFGERPLIAQRVDHDKAAAAIPAGRSGADTILTGQIIFPCGKSKIHDLIRGDKRAEYRPFSLCKISFFFKELRLICPCAESTVNSHTSGLGQPITADRYRKRIERVIPVGKHSIAFLAGFGSHSLK